MEQIFGPFYAWISGPYRGLAIKFIAFLVAVEALDLALGYLPKFIERRRADRRWAQEKQYWE